MAVPKTGVRKCCQGHLQSQSTLHLDSKNGNETTGFSLHCVALDGWLSEPRRKELGQIEGEAGIKKSEVLLAFRIRTSSPGLRHTHSRPKGFSHTEVLGEIFYRLNTLKKRKQDSCLIEKQTRLRGISTHVQGLPAQDRG